MRSTQFRRTPTPLRRVAALFTALGCLFASDAVAQYRDARCVAPQRVEIAVVWDSVRGVVADLGRETMSSSLNQGCPLVIAPHGIGRETHRWTFYGRAGIVNYKNELGSHDDAGGFGIKRTGPKVGTITIGVRREF